MPISSTKRGLVVKTATTTHTATIPSGPRTGETHSCTCTRRRDHYVAMGADDASNATQPPLF